MVQWFLEDVDAIARAMRESYEQMPLAVLCRDHGGFKVGLLIGMCKSVDDFFHRCAAGSGEVNVVRRSVDKTVCLDRVSAGQDQAVPIADRQGSLHQQRVVAFKQGGQLKFAIRGSGPATADAVGEADGVVTTAHAGDRRSTIGCSVRG